MRIEVLSPLRKRLMYGKRRRVFLIGYYGRGNFGDDLMRLCLLAPLRNRGLRVVSVDGSIDDGIARRGGYSAVPQKLKWLWCAVRRSEWVVLGGGTHVHDDFIPGRIGAALLTLTKLWVGMLLARRVGARVAAVSVGVGPLTTAFGRLIGRAIFKQVAFVAVRDRQSRSVLMRLGYRGRLVNTSDVTLILAGQKPNGAGPQHVGKRPGTRVIGVCPGGTCTKSRGRTQQEKERFWYDLGQRLGKYSLGKSRVELRVFEVCSKGRDSDTGAVRAFLQGVRRSGLRCSKISYNGEPLAFLEQLASCDRLVAARYHSVLAAVIRERPVFAIAYHDKVVALCQEFGVPFLSTMRLSDGEWRELYCFLENGRPAPRKITAETASQCVIENLGFLFRSDVREV